MFAGLDEGLEQSVGSWGPACSVKRFFDKLVVDYISSSRTFSGG